MPSHIPAIIEGAKTTQGGQFEIAKAAEASLVSQCTMLLTQLQTIVDTSSERALEKINAQTYFLADRMNDTNQVSASSLQLAAKPGVEKPAPGRKATRA